MDSSLPLSTSNIIRRKGLIIRGPKDPLEVSLAHGNKPLTVYYIVVELTAVILY